MPIIIVMCPIYFNMLSERSYKQINVRKFISRHFVYNIIMHRCIWGVARVSICIKEKAEI